MNTLIKITITALTLSALYISASFLIYDFKSPYYDQEELTSDKQPDQKIIVTLNRFNGYDIGLMNRIFNDSETFVSAYIIIEPIFNPIERIARILNHDPISFESHYLKPKPGEIRECGTGSYGIVNEKY
jgi:hypothetical protein